MILSELIWIGQFVLEAVVKVWPAFALTLLISALIGALRLDGVIRAAFSRHAALAVLFATAIGAFSPFCSCTVIPIVRGLLASGVPLAPVMAFWLASPTMDPEIFTLSVATLGWPLAFARLIATLIFSAAGGYLALALVRAGVLAGSALADETPISAPAAPIPVAARRLAIALPMLPARLFTASDQMVASRPQIVLPAWASDLFGGLAALNWREVGKQILRDHWRIGRWLTVAFVLEAIILRYVPQAQVAALLGQQTQFAVPLAALIGVPLYLNNVGALPIVAGLLEKGMSPGAAIAFLISGPVTTLPAMTAVWGVAKKRVFAVYLGVSLIGAIAMGYLANLVFEAF